jgi:hypothetical protein
MIRAAGGNRKTKTAATATATTARKAYCSYYYVMANR